MLPIRDWKAALAHQYITGIGEAPSRIPFIFHEIVPSPERNIRFPPAGLPAPSWFNSWRNLMPTKLCACCGKPFQPVPHVPHQAYCSARDCQRARKRQWHHGKLQNDPDYRVNQRDAQRAWQARHPGYWRGYRDVRPAQPSSEQRGTGGVNRTTCPAKMDVLTLPAGLYQIRTLTIARPLAGEAWLVEIRPICPDCPCKMDVCKERT